jgi:hypothetical protein
MESPAARPGARTRYTFRLADIATLARSFVVLGVLAKERTCFWKILGRALFRPKTIPLAISLMVNGFSFRKFFEQARLAESSVGSF